MDKYNNIFWSILFSSGVKMVNQLLAGVHIASAAEAMAFAARLGLNTRLLFDFITVSGGTSWYVSSMKLSLTPLLFPWPNKENKKQEKSLTSFFLVVFFSVGVYIPNNHFLKL